MDKVLGVFGLILLLLGTLDRWSPTFNNRDHARSLLTILFGVIMLCIAMLCIVFEISLNVQ